MKHERKSARGETRTLAFQVRGLELRADTDPDVTEDDGRLIMRGHAAVFDRMSEDLGGFTERIARGAFRKALDRGDDVRLLVNHDGLPLARTKNQTLELREDPKGLHVYAELADTTLARDLRTLIKRGDVDQMSFGFTIEEDRWDELDGFPVRTILKIGRLFDVSAVTYPAYTQTDVSMRADEPEMSFSTSTPGGFREMSAELVRRTDETSEERSVEEEPAQAVASVDTDTLEDTQTSQALLRELEKGARRRLLIARTYPA